MDAFDRWAIIISVVAAFGIGFGFGKTFARDFIAKEAARCLEAPDIDTARVCWDAATLGWRP